MLTQRDIIERILCRFPVPISAHTIQREFEHMTRTKMSTTVSGICKKLIDEKRCVRVRQGWYASLEAAELVEILK